MRTGAIPLQIDLTELLAKARRQFSGRVGDIPFNLPFSIFSAQFEGDHNGTICR